MLEILLLIISAGLTSAGSDSTSVQTEIAAVPLVEESDASTPLFLAPEPEAQGDDTIAQTPLFLAPKEETAPTPLFLAPQAESAADAAPQLQAEPQEATGRFTTALEVKPILGATKSAWVAVREYGGQDLLYVTHLWAWRCGLLEMRIGINGDTPEVWPLPDCHLEQPTPGAILESDGLPYRAFGLNSVHLIEVEVLYDDLSTDSQKFSRQGIPIP